jgi:uncharacterized membrane protein YhaH (DUF805 family)
VGYFDTMLRYFEFGGRSSRTQYWLFQLGYVVLLVGAVYADYAQTGLLPSREDPGFWTLFVLIVHVVPQVTVTVRRLHDSGRSGWWFWISLVPVIGGLWLLVLMFLGPNSEGETYGSDPRFGEASVRKRGSGMSRADEMLMAISSRRNAAPATAGIAPASGRFIE